VGGIKGGLHGGLSPCPPLYLWAWYVKCNIAGKFSGNGETFGINQLAMKENGDIALPVTTEQADKALCG
jgi:hypothetical protein